MPPRDEGLLADAAKMQQREERRRLNAIEAERQLARFASRNEEHVGARQRAAARGAHDREEVNVDNDDSDDDDVDEDEELVDDDAGDDGGDDSGGGDDDDGGGGVGGGGGEDDDDNDDDEPSSRPSATKAKAKKAKVKAKAKVTAKTKKATNKKRVAKSESSGATKKARLTVAASDTSKRINSGDTSVNSRAMTIAVERLARAHERVKLLKASDWNNSKIKPSWIGVRMGCISLLLQQTPLENELEDSDDSDAEEQPLQSSWFVYWRCNIGSCADSFNRDDNQGHGRVEIWRSGAGGTGNVRDVVGSIAAAIMLTDFSQVWKHIDNFHYETGKMLRSFDTSSTLSSPAAPPQRGTLTSMFNLTELIPTDIGIAFLDGNVPFVLRK